MTTKKVDKVSECEQRLFSLEIQVTFKRIKGVIVAAILIRGIRLFNHHIRCYMINVTIRKTHSMFCQEMCLAQDQIC